MLKYTSMLVIAMIISSSASKREELMKAVDTGNVQLVESILKSDKSLVNTQDGYSLAILHVAAGSGNLPLLEVLIAANASLDIKLDHRGKHREGETPLHFAATEDRFEAIAKLVAAGATVGIETIAGYTPLHVASGLNHVRSMQVLLANGANLRRKATNKYGSFPIHLAATSGPNSAEAVKLILSLVPEHADVSNDMEDYPLHGACLVGGTVAVVELLKSGAKSDRLNRRGKTPLQAAEDLAMTGDQGTEELVAALPLLQALLQGTTTGGDDNGLQATSDVSGRSSEHQEL